MTADKEWEEGDLWPTWENPCYDCGSTIPDHHTTLCDLADGQIKDLPCFQDTQHWAASYDKDGNNIPAHLRPRTI